MKRDSDRLFAATFVRRSPAAEADIQRAICDLLRLTGWVVVETSQGQRADWGLVGCPDVIAFKAGTCWLIECKTAKGKLRASQVLFADRIAEHLSETLRYTVARSVDDVIDLVQRPAPAGAREDTR